MKKDLGSAFDTSLYTGPKSEVVKVWMDMFSEDKLTSAYLHKWVSAKIPEFYILEECGPMFHRFKSSALTSTLTAYLEEFIYCGEKDGVNEFLQRTGQVMSVCGKSLKHGEPSYSCRECRADHTCVLCVECFQRSQHRNHKYRMSVASGGGYCDCGDSEAWKSHPSCDSHKPRSDTNAAPPFPSDMHKRSKLVCLFMLRFSYDVINKFYCADLQDEKVSSNNDSKSQYLVLLYNDEIHTFDHVINLLVQLIGCTQREGLELASKINREGRAVITASDFETCIRLKSDIERLSKVSSDDRFLEAHVLPFGVVAEQCFALESLEWMQSLLKTNQGFCTALIEVLEDCSPNTFSLLDLILVHDLVLWKSAKVQWNGLLCSGFLRDNQTKKILAEHYLTNYSQIMQNYVNDDENHAYSTAGLSVQLFTVPSIAHELISRYSALGLIMDFIIKMRNVNGKLEFEKVIRSFNRVCYVLIDWKYLLCSRPTSTWSEQLRLGFCTGMSSFLHFLGFIEGVDASKRQLGSHIEFEPEWEAAFELQKICFLDIDASLEWCLLDYQALKEVFITAVDKLECIYRNQPGEETLFNVLGSTFTFKKFDTSENAVSIHLPLTRFWGALYSILAYKYSSNLKEDHEIESIVELIDPVIRARAMVAQFRSGLWHKNGQSVRSQVKYYHDINLRANTLDMDILVLQIGASLIDSDAFLINLAYKFGILSVIFPGNETTRELPETDSKKLWALVDEFLYLIIVLIAERFSAKFRIVGDVTYKDCLKHELTHVLAFKPMSHPELEKAIYPLKLEESESMVTVLKELTTFKLANESHGKGQYELKDEYRPNFNVFFYHFTKEISFKSEQVQKALYMKQNGCECCPPPTLPPFLEPYSKIINLLNSEFTLHTMKLVLDVWIKEAKLELDGLLHKIIFLFGLAIMEEERSIDCYNNAFVFTSKARESRIVTTMVDIYCSGRLKDQKDLMKWVLQRYGNVAEDQSVVAAMFDYDEKQNNETRQSETRARAEAARAKIMANMNMMQQKFYKNFGESEGVQDNMEVSTLDTEASLICILCQERESLAMEGKTMVYAAFVQLSTVHMRNREPFTPEDLTEIFLTAKLGPSPFVSTCGHVMHADCWEAWRLDVARNRATSPSHGTPFSHDPSKNEYLCPLCESISNIAMPILPNNTLDSINTSENCEPCLTFKQWLEITLKLLHVSGLGEKNCADSVKNTPQHDTVLQQTTSLDPFPKPLGRIISDVGYNLDFGEKWVLNVKRLDYNAFQADRETDWMEIPTGKLNWIHAIGSEIFKVGKNSRNQLDTVHWDCTMVWKTLAFTILSLETNLRYSGKPIFSGLTPREQACLENLVRISYVLSINKQPRFLRIGANLCAIKLLNMIVINGKDSRCVLEWDTFGVLVELLVVAPNIVSGSPEQVPSIENFLLRLMLCSKIAQILITLNFEKYRKTSPKKISHETECIQFIVSVLGHKCVTFDTDGVWGEVKERLRPFLRCCSIFFHYKQPNKFSNDIDLKNDTFENLASYLQLPSSCKELLNDDLTIHLFMSWAEHPKISDFHVNCATSWKFEPYIKEIGATRINGLVKLPREYSELLNRVRDFSCSEFEIGDSQNPTMCLVCGKILCSQSYCCQTELNQQKVRR